MLHNTFEVAAGMTVFRYCELMDAGAHRAFSHKGDLIDLIERIG